MFFLTKHCSNQKNQKPLKIKIFRQKKEFIKNHHVELYRISIETPVKYYLKIYVRYSMEFIYYSKYIKRKMLVDPRPCGGGLQSSSCSANLSSNFKYQVHQLFQIPLQLYQLPLQQCF